MASDEPVEPLALDDLDFVYELKKPVGIRPVLYSLGGLTLLGVAGVVFLIGLLLPPENQSFPAFIIGTVVPTLGAVTAFGSAIALVRSPRRATVGSKGLIAEDDRGRRGWRWEEIGWAAVSGTGLGQRRQLSIFDPQGKKLVSLGDVFEDFDGLAESVKSAIARKGGDTAGQVQQRKARRSAALLIGGGLMFLAISIGMGVHTWGERQAAKRLASEGVEADAAIKRHYFYNVFYNVTPRLEYALTTPEGTTVTRDVMMTRDGWNALEGAKHVRVRYEPAHPENNRLVAGEVEGEFGPPELNLLIAGAGCLLALFFVGVGVMQWKGWDIDLDSKTGKLSIKRFGTGR